jgi:hypothetical protein
MKDIRAVRASTTGINQILDVTYAKSNLCLINCRRSAGPWAILKLKKNIK